MLRSCYKVKMVFRTGDAPVEVQWYWADNDAKCFPGFSRFASANWINRDVNTGDLGEQPGFRTWVDGKKPPRGYIGDQASGDCAKARASWWTDGIPVSESVGPFNPQGVPLCCINPPCCGCNLPATLQASISGFGCACIPASTITFTRVGSTCIWQSPTFDCSGSDLRFTIEVQEFETTCDLRVRMYCDDEEVGTEAAELDCDSEEAFITFNPSLNDCCASTIDVDVSWVL